MRVGIRKEGEVKWSESRSVMSNSLLLHGLYSPWNSPGQNTGVGSLFLLQGIFPTQGSNPGPLHCRRILYQLNHKKRRWEVSKPTGHTLQFCFSPSGHLNLPASFPLAPLLIYHTKLSEDSHLNLGSKLSKLSSTLGMTNVRAFWILKR